MVEFSDLFESEAEEFQKKAKVGSIPLWQLLSVIDTTRTRQPPLMFSVVFQLGDVYL